MDDIIKSLYKTVASRKQDAEKGSYTGYLFEQGLDKILKKVGEECAETIIAAKNGNNDEIVLEICDLVYHLLVMASQCDIELSDIEDELKRRSEKIGNLKEMKKVDRES